MDTSRNEEIVPEIKGRNSSRKHKSIGLEAERELVRLIGITRERLGFGVVSIVIAVFVLVIVIVIVIVVVVVVVVVVIVVIVVVVVVVIVIKGGGGLASHLMTRVNDKSIPRKFSGEPQTYPSKK